MNILVLLLKTISLFLSTLVIRLTAQLDMGVICLLMFPDLNVKNKAEFSFCGAT